MILDAGLFHLVRELFSLLTVDGLTRAPLTLGDSRQKSLEISPKSEHRDVPTTVFPTPTGPVMKIGTVKRPESTR